MSWNTVENYLVDTRYAVKNPKTGESLEKTYKDVTDRIVKGLEELSSLKNNKIIKALPNNELFNICNAIQEKYIIPATPFLLSFNNPHTKRKGYFSCFPLGKIEDSMEGIAKSCNDMRIIYQNGGGAGADVSGLRPEGYSVDNGQGLASGPVSFLTKLDAEAGTTNQGGRRKGALLVQMDHTHPDIKKFIHAKSLAPKISNFISTLPKDQRPSQNLVLSNMNLSVNVKKGFWESVELIDMIAQQIWETGDPGLLFIDNMIENTPFKKEDDPIYVNPCGEYTSKKNLACNLITINVAKIAYDIYKSNLEDKHILSEFYKEVFSYARLACLLGNIIIELDEGYPSEEIRKETQKYKPVGVGMSGFHTALLLLTKYRYGDKNAVKFAKNTQDTLTMGTLNASMFLTEKFEEVAPCNRTYWKDFMKKSHYMAYNNVNNFLANFELFQGFYNIVTTSQAPTGSVSQFLNNLDTGIEPYFALEQQRRVRDFKDSWKSFTLRPKYLKAFLENPENKKFAKSQTADKLTADEQLNMLAAFQSRIQTGISKTINLPNSATVQDVKDIILKARKLKLKGLTIFRDGCRGSDQVLAKLTANTKSTVSLNELKSERNAKIYECKGPLTTYITITNDENNKIREVFINSGSNGTHVNAINSMIGRILSTSLRRHPEDLDFYIKTLSKVEMGEFYSCGEIRAKNLPSMVSKLLSKRAKELNSNFKGVVMEGLDICPECKELSLYRSGSCNKCKLCQYTSC